ncbi:M1 family metallopeptidase [Cellulomonas endophytica]|uniref:M1 family metallopeptidase n=1 Tax=Cellulomonas endophytica TaxID=2494735 RepID=UPI001F0C75A9|nr:M1 family metallopeptidase [Cellulomonas endophytica]
MVPDPYVPHRGGGGLRVERYDLELDYRVRTNRLAGTARLQGVATLDVDRVTLDLDRLRVEDVRVDGARARWTHRDGRLVVRLPAPVRAGTGLVVEVRYAGAPRPTRGPWGEVGWEELTDGVLVAGQPDGAPSWFPCVDLPGEKAELRLVLTTEPGYTLVGNAPVLARTSRAGSVRWELAPSAPLAPYLATVQLGRYERHVLAPGPDGGPGVGQDVRQEVHAPAARRAGALRDLARQPVMMRLFSDLFGPYPFDSYAVVVTDDPLEIPLEAQGLSVFGAQHLDGRGGYERLVAHELAHQWFGNSLTATTWRDIWLHEGFACYAEWLWWEASGQASADRTAREALTRLRRLPQDLVLTEPGAERMFDDRVYQRGALTVHALRRAVGDGPFVDVLRAWTARYRHATVRTADLLAVVREVAGRDVSPVLLPWLQEAGLPDLPSGSGGGRLRRLRL